jgi:hypothetical protein
MLLFNPHLASLANDRLDEDLDVDAEEVSRDPDTHGKIVLIVQRGDLTKTESSDPYASVLWNGYDAPDTKISSKQVIKDSRVSHAAR